MLLFIAELCDNIDEECYLDCLLTKNCLSNNISWLNFFNYFGNTVPQYITRALIKEVLKDWSNDGLYTALIILFFISNICFFEKIRMIHLVHETWCAMTIMYIWWYRWQNVCVCMYVCMYVYMYVCMNVCTHLNMLITTNYVM